MRVLDAEIAAREAAATGAGEAREHESESEKMEVEGVVAAVADAADVNANEVMVAAEGVVAARVAGL